MFSRIRNRYLRFAVAVFMAALISQQLGTNTGGGGGGGTYKPPPPPSVTFTDHGGVSALIRSWNNGTYIGEIDTTSYLTDSNGVIYQYTIDRTRVLLEENCNGSIETDTDQTVLVPLSGDPTATHVNRATGGYANAPLSLSCPLMHALGWSFWWDLDTSAPTVYNHDGFDYKCHDFGGANPTDPCYPFDY